MSVAVGAKGSHGATDANGHRQSGSAELCIAIQVLSDMGFMHILAILKCHVECHADLDMTQGPDACLCSYIGHLYRGSEMETDASSSTIAG